MFKLPQFLESHNKNEINFIVNANNFLFMNIILSTDSQYRTLNELIIYVYLKAQAAQSRRQHEIILNPLPMTTKWPHWTKVLEACSRCADRALTKPSSSPTTPLHFSAKILSSIINILDYPSDLAVPVPVTR